MKICKKCNEPMSRLPNRYRCRPCFNANARKDTWKRTERTRWFQLKQNTPAWADRDAIKETYRDAYYEGLVVDHIYPVTGSNVSGLHVKENLQLLTNDQNLRKGFKHPEAQKS